MNPTWGCSCRAVLAGDGFAVALPASVAVDKCTCRSRSISSSSSWQAFFCVLSKAAWRDNGTSLQAVSGCREETEELGERVKERIQLPFGWWDHYKSYKVLGHVT